jgi:hypothetical protein
MDLANTTVADVFLKTSLTENDWVTKVHAVVALPMLFVILVVQSSFFYAVYEGAEEKDSAGQTGAGLLSLFVRCSLLLLCVVIDSADFFSDWNVVEVGPQMLPSLAFISLLILGDFCDAILEQEMETRKENYKLRLVTCVVETAVSSMYALFALLVACHYLVGGFAPMREFITDTRWTTVNVLFVVFILVDAFSAFARVLLKVRKLLHRNKQQDVAEKEMTISKGKADSQFTAYAFESPAFGSSIDLNKVVFRTEPGKKSR